MIKIYLSLQDAYFASAKKKLKSYKLISKYSYQVILVTSPGLIPKLKENSHGECFYDQIV